MSDKITMKIEGSLNDTWMINNDGQYRRIVFDKLVDDMSEESAEDIFKNANKILRKCPNPLKNDAISNTGIVIGKVQSGKTSNFISLIALAFDNGYQIAVVLGGNKKNLVSQNAERIEEYMNISGVVVLSTTDNDDILITSQIENFIDQGKKVIIVGLKHQKHINKIKDLFYRTSLNLFPTLIIDDEGDQATLNTQVKSNKKSVIYKSALDLKESIKVHSFISVTATPQANILIDQLDKLSPDFGVLTYPGVGYCGLSTFHGDQQDKYIRIIPDDEPDLYSGFVIPKSFKEAFAVFFVGGAIRKYRGDTKKHSFLVHPSQKKPDHKAAVEKINRIKDEWTKKAKIELSGQNDISYAGLRKSLLSAYDDIKKTCINIPSFEEIEKDILNIIVQCSPALICNSDSDASKNAKLYDYAIYVGGNMVERGITIKGLAVTYITRRAKGIANVDNTEQRARWFGYKESYLDVCRIYTTKAIKDDFSKIYEHDEDLWSTIERSQKRGIKFKDLPRIFKLSSSLLRLTRQNVATTESFDYSEWTKEDYFLFDKEKSDSNVKVVDDFKNNNIEKISNFIIKGHEYDNYKIFKNFSYSFVSDNLLNKLYYSSESNLNISTVRRLDEAITKLELNPTVDVVYMRTSESCGSRSLYDDGKVNQLFQGRSKNITETSYPGDASLPDEHPDNIQIQIHKIKPSNRSDIDYCSVLIAIYIPESIARKIDTLVGRL